MNLDAIWTALGIVLPVSGAGIKGFLSLRDRVQTAESKIESHNEVVLVKLDAIAEKIDLRCDALEQRVARIERKVLNGDYNK